MLNLQNLNAVQRQAVTYGEGPLLLLAGPGSGKTHTITHRILYLIEEKQVPAAEILVITFTKAAALAMQERFKKQSLQFHPVSFGTFHSIFYQFLRESKIIPDYEFMNPQRKKALLKEALFLSGKCEKYPVNTELDELDSAIAYYKNTGRYNISQIPVKWQDCIGEILRHYERLRKETHLMDFDDILFECLNAFKCNEAFRKMWQGRFAHILIDEFQDMNPIQYEILKYLTGPKSSIFAVGDDDQAIYGFRGSNPECMRRFQQDYHAKELVLDVNYRSCKGIVEASLKVIAENKNRFMKKYRAADENSESRRDSVYLHEFPEREELYTYLQDKLKKVQDSASYAVIFRTNAHMQYFACRLLKQGIPFQMRENLRNPYEHDVAKDIFAYLRMAKGPVRREDFIRVMNKPFRALNREPLQTENVSLDQFKKYYRKRYDAYSGYGRQGKFQQENQALENAEKLFQQLNYLSKLQLHVGVRFIFKAMGYEQYCKMQSRSMESRLEEYEDMYSWLLEEAKQYESIDDWQKEAAEYQVITKTVKNNGNIHLMTAHASKGLEFDHVIIPECNEKVFPRSSTMDKESCEEERRIFYVAMTRAKKSLELLYTLHVQERPRLPSRFITPINQKQFRQIHSCPGTHQTCPQPSHIHHHPR